MARKGEPDWNLIKTEYITTNVSLRGLAKEHGINLSCVANACKKGEWVKEREQYRNDCHAKALQKTAEIDVNYLVAAIEGANGLLDAAVEKIRDHDQFNRHIVYESPLPGTTEAREKIFQKADTKAMRDLAALIKDMTGLLREFFNVPTPAQQEAQRIAAERLELDKRRLELEEQKAEAELTPESQEYVVRFEGVTTEEAESFGK